MRLRPPICIVAIHLLLGCSKEDPSIPEAEVDQDPRGLIEKLVRRETNDFEDGLEARRNLIALGELSLPALEEHLEDKRPTNYSRNHYIVSTVGDACYWIIHDLLLDRPRNYSSYGYSRKGRDGENHPKPYWKGTPFSESGGLTEWLDAHQDTSFTEKQILCLNWLLEGERAIGAWEPDGYFQNILPLEIRILERRKETGESVDMQLARLREVVQKRLVGDVPLDLLPPKTEQAEDTNPPPLRD